VRHIPVIPHSRSATALIGLIAAFAAPRTPLFAAQDSSLTRVVHQATLENGLQVIVVENHTVPLATVLVAVRNGAFTQDSADQGLAHLYEHMLFHSYRHDPSAFAVEATYLKGRYNGGTGDEVLRARTQQDELEYAAQCEVAEREGAGNSVRRVGAHVGRIVGWPSHAFTGCFDTSSD